MASEAVQSPSPPDTGVLSGSTTPQPLAIQKSICASLPLAAMTLVTHPSAALLTNLCGSLITRPHQSAVLVSQLEQEPRAVVHLAAGPELEAPDTYYVDSPSDEEEGTAVEAQVDTLMGDLEVLFQEQLASLTEDLAEYQAARKGKAVATDPSP